MSECDFTIPTLVTYSDDSSSYNSFCSIIEADTYHGRRLGNDTWRSADEDSRTSALFHATDILHRQKWIGAPKTYDQPLAWPRRFVPNRNSINQGFRGELEYIDVNTPVSLTFQYIDDDSIPQFLKDATAELANFLLLRGNSDKNELSIYDDDIDSINLGGALNIQFNSSKNNIAITDMPDAVLNIVRDFLREVTEADPNYLGAQSIPLIRS
jgi:hypothetical protein